MTTIQELEHYLSESKENAHLEFKEAKKQHDYKKLLRYCVAIANEGGGKYILGVTDKLPRSVVGTNAFKNIDKIQQDIFDALRFRVDVEEIDYYSKRAVIFSIPSRAKGIPYSLNGAYYMRSGEELVPMSEDQLRKIFSEGKISWLLQNAKANCDDAEVISLLDIQAYFDMMHLPLPIDRQGILERLQKGSIIHKSKDTWHITNLGALLFAKKLQNFDQLSRRGARVIVYKENNKLETKLDVPGTKGYAVGFHHLIDFIQSQTAQNEVIEQAIRKSIKMYPKIAIRELVANALVHQDFSETGSSVMIEIYGDRIEISNPGLPLIETDRFIDEYKTRNEKLANLMRRLGICEEQGSGIDKVITAVEAFQLPPPDIRISSHHTTVVLFAPKEINNMSRKDRIRACYQHCILRYVTNQGGMSNKTLRERFKLPDSKAELISRIIKDAINENKIKLEDSESSSRKHARYVPCWA